MKPVPALIATALLFAAQSALASGKADELRSLFNIKEHCREVAEFAGGSYQIESACRKQEEASRNLLILDSPAIPNRIYNHCKGVAEFGGSSYQILRACIENEMKAKEELQY